MFDGLRVLVLDDEVLVALDLADMLEEMGCRPVGPFYRAEAALAALENDRPDFAMLDVNLGRGTTSEPVARRLEELGVPFAFATGYSSSKVQVPARFPQAPKLIKPLSERDLKGLLEREMGHTPS